MPSRNPATPGDNSLQKANTLLAAISRAQEHFIREDDPRQLFDGLLKDFLQLTESAYGFIGEILHTDEGKPYLKTHAISNIAWNDETRQFYEKNAPQGLQFFNLQTLFGAVIETGEPVIANAPANDPRSAGTPVGHPRLDAFLGVPVHSGDSLVGMIGVANRAGGYEATQIAFLQPLLKTCGQLIYSYRIRKQREQSDDELRRSRGELEKRVRERTEDLEDLHASLLEEVAERKQTEKKLRESNEILERIFATTHFSMVYLDRNFNFIRVNKAYADTCGHPPEFFPGKNHFELYPHEENEAIFRRVVETGAPFTIYAKPFEFPDHPEWGVTYWDWSLYPVLAADGAVEGLIFILLDVTERKKAEEKIRVSEARFRTMVEQSPFSIQIFSPDGLTLRANRAWEKLWGVPFDHITGYNILRDQQLIDKGIMPYIQKGFAGEATEIPPVNYNPAENVGIRGPHNDRWVRAFIYPVVDESGSMKEVILMHEDVTERRKAEERLRQAAAVFEHTAEAVVITDPQANIRAVNRAFSEITGYSPEEALGQNPRLLKSERHDKGFYETMWDSLQKAGYWRGELWNRRKSGEVFPVWSTISAIHDETGQLTHYVSVFSDISTLKRSEEQLYYLAHHDPLTDLPNRLLFTDRIEHAMVRARREKYRLALLFLDLDRFKNINDGFGHPTGDRLLQEAALRITRLVREEDTVARLGGDEFVILMEEIDESGDAAILATKLVLAFSQPFFIDNHELHVTISVGISIFPEDGNDATALIRNADAAMYRAKEEGRNDFQFYTRELTSRAFEKVLLETSLRRALEREEFCLFYQPQVSLKTGRITGAEALLRWQHPTMGSLLPSKFISLAEETGLIVPIGEWVLRKACTQMNEWLAAGLPLERVSVNVSGVQVTRGDSDFPATVQSILAEKGLDPRHLELELTESVIMEKIERSLSIMDRLRKVGVRLAIDDFGTGYSSLSQLKQMPVDRLKIDQSFVRGIPHDADDKAIVCAVIALGYVLKLHVSAEGAETDEQREFLENQGCEELQGFLTGAPMPAEELVRLLSAGKA